MSEESYAFCENHEWHGIFMVTIDGKEYQTGGTLTYKSDELFAADVIPSIDFPFQIENEKSNSVYAHLIDKKTGDLLHATLLNCLILKTKNLFNRRSGASTSLKLIPRFALFSGSFFNTETDIIKSIDVEYNVWPEFAYPQGFKSSKSFEPLHWRIDLKNKLSLLSCESVTAHPIESDFNAGSMFVGGEDSDLQKITEVLKPILKEKGARVMFKNSDSHRWYLKFEQQEESDQNKELADYTEKIWALCQLLYLFTHDKKTSPFKITLHAKQKDDQYTQSSALLYRWSGIKDKTSYRNMSDVLFMQKIGVDAVKDIIRLYFEKYDRLSAFLDVLYHNNTKEAFSVFHVSRIIDCWAIIAGEKGLLKTKKDEVTKYQTLFEWWVDGDNVLITRIEKLFEIAKNEVGKKISSLRTAVVHFTPGAKSYDIKEYFKAYAFLELVLIDYIFEEIGLSQSLRKEYKIRYLPGDH
jgi:hypothetical protein